MLSHNNKYTDNPKDFNKRVSEAKSLGQGCVNTRACEGCGLIVRDSICLCINAFDCPKCGYQQRVNYIPSIDNWWDKPSIFWTGNLELTHGSGI